MKKEGSENMKRAQVAASEAKGINNRREFVHYGERATEGWKKRG